MEELDFLSILFAFVDLLAFAGTGIKVGGAGEVSRTGISPS